MKLFLGPLWVLSAVLFFFLGHFSSEFPAPSIHRGPASVVLPKIIGQSVTVSLGDSGGVKYQAKVDTGAESSSLHAFDIQVYYVKNVPFVSYKTKDDNGKVHYFKKLVTKIDDVRNSNGTTIRYYVHERVWLDEVPYDVEVNLSNREEMTFKFLLGKNLLRQAEFYVDPNKDVIIYEETAPRYVYRQ
jgi:hypothetical protein